MKNVITAYTENTVVNYKASCWYVIWYKCSVFIFLCYQDTLELCTREQEFKSIFFSLCYFHTCVSGRLKFGPQGWNRRYPFNMGDLTICVNVLYNYLEANTKVRTKRLSNFLTKRIGNLEMSKQCNHFSFKSNSWKFPFCGSGSSKILTEDM